MKEILGRIGEVSGFCIKKGSKKSQVNTQITPLKIVAKERQT